MNNRKFPQTEKFIDQTIEEKRDEETYFSPWRDLLVQLRRGWERIRLRGALSPIRGQNLYRDWGLTGPLGLTY